MDQVSLPGQEAFLRVTEVPGHLTPPQPLRLPGDSPDLHPSTGQVDEEEDQEPRQPLAPPGLEGEEIRRSPSPPAAGTGTPSQWFSAPAPAPVPAPAPSAGWRWCRAPPHAPDGPELPGFSGNPHPGSRWPCGPPAVGSPPA